MASKGLLKPADTEDQEELHRESAWSNDSNFSFLTDVVLLRLHDPTIQSRKKSQLLHSRSHLCLLLAGCESPALALVTKEQEPVQYTWVSSLTSTVQEIQRVTKEDLSCSQVEIFHITDAFMVTKCEYHDLTRTMDFSKMRGSNESRIILVSARTAERDWKVNNLLDHLAMSSKQFAYEVSVVSSHREKIKTKESRQTTVPIQATLVVEGRCGKEPRRYAPALPAALTERAITLRRCSVTSVMQSTSCTMVIIPAKHKIVNTLGRSQYTKSPNHEQKPDCTLGSDYDTFDLRSGKQFVMK
ncbi:hypothetical protein Anapl_18435 [Anas platyrhynchos]|uniref:Uncharacterized protein n=1 Tax=Anas platyrhynchos TaxID=8839 RepID=R0KLG3_ANAPL|nr:hypothetical protein Anapl_18435 [Anas platyrhynchos]